MADLISREAALAAIDNERNILIEQERLGAEHIVVHHARRLIEDLPAVDAVPIVYGEWTTKRTWMHDGEWYCSVCDYEPVVFMESSYCPNCGAKMDAGDEDDAKTD